MGFGVMMFREAPFSGRNFSTRRAGALGQPVGVERSDLLISSSRQPAGSRRVESSMLSRKIRDLQDRCILNRGKIPPYTNLTFTPIPNFPLTHLSLFDFLGILKCWCGRPRPLFDIESWSLYPQIRPGARNISGKTRMRTKLRDDSLAATNSEILGRDQTDKTNNARSREEKNENNDRQQVVWIFGEAHSIFIPLSTTLIRAKRCPRHLEAARQGDEGQKESRW